MILNLGAGYSTSFFFFKLDKIIDRVSFVRQNNYSAIDQGDQGDSAIDQGDQGDSAIDQGNYCSILSEIELNFLWM